VFLLVLSLFSAQSLAANLLTTALFESNLDPTQEVPPSTISAHSGTAKLQFDLKTKYLAWIVDHTVWDSTGAQLHGPAAPGATAPVLIDLGEYVGFFFFFFRKKKANRLLQSQKSNQWRHHSKRRSREVSHGRVVVF